MQDSSGVEPRPGYGSGSDLPATELDRGHADHETKWSSVRQNHANMEDDRINRECKPEAWNGIKSAAADGSRLESRTIRRHQNVNFEIALHIVIASRVRVTRIDQGAVDRLRPVDRR
ncbi:hypothetical protein [Cryobacterium shii]|uniref:Uncharacterized protein n=1 Tax=Cryobacterium shii TaxID=1259235 RepID=A0AAQ2C4V0_9MICO|nr:hypothetical protein [Cryobacterium shii]TFC44331.1 hypothetical protein E3O49_11815 [Cryobacterium shii]TFD20907.1 hypothetical protein E3T42_01035 [Cryobacterium sp. TMT4-10]